MCGLQLFRICCSFEMNAITEELFLVDFRNTLLSRVAYEVAYEVPELLGKLQKYEQAE